MKKFVMISAALLLVMSLNAFATDTRVLTLGGTNQVVLDEANIWLYPSRINDYPNLAIGEFATPNDFTSFGVHFKINRDNPWILAGYFDNVGMTPPLDLMGQDTLMRPGFSDSLMDNHRIHVFYGRNTSMGNLGFRVSALQSSYTKDEANDRSKQAFAYYDFNAGLTSTDGAWDIAARFGIGAITDDKANGDPLSESDGYWDLGLAVRSFRQLNPNYTFIPHLEFLRSRRGMKHFAAAVDSMTYSVVDQNVTLNLGAGINYTPATNVFAVADVGFTYNHQKYETLTTGGTPVYDENDYNNFFLPYFKLGLDADVFKWLDVRFGATSVWNRSSDELKNSFGTTSITTKDKFNYAENATYLGFGFHWNRLHIDTYTDPGMFLDGFNFLSGADNNMNFQLSAVYEMM